jgi:hypothetical protein
MIVVALLWWRKKVPEVRSENAPFWFWRHESWAGCLQVGILTLREIGYRSQLLWY